MPKRKTDATDDPDKLTRQQAGTYRTADARFEVRQGDLGWFLVDAEQANEFGQELIHGPYATLAAVREAIPAARTDKVTPIRPPRAAKRPRSPRKAAPSPPPSWIDALPPAERGTVRRLIAALSDAGVEDAEALVRRDRDGLMPVVATRLLERRLESIVEGVPASERAAATALVRRIAAVLTSDGLRPAGPMPGWTVVELGPEPAPPNRRIELD
jgi:hypothetical protein